MQRTLKAISKDTKGATHNAGNTWKDDNSYIGPWGKFVARLFLCVYKIKQPVLETHSGAAIYTYNRACSIAVIFFYTKN